jgi:High potential iron-sulfur protein
MQRSFSRRTLITNGLMFVTIVPTLSIVASSGRAAESMPLDPKDPTAQALGYVMKSPNPAQRCANCSLFQASAGDVKGGCKLFPGKQVAADAYCKSWAKKS